MAPHIVKAPAVQVTAGARAYFLERGATVPEGVSEADVKRLVAEGFIEPVATKPAKSGN